MRTVKIYVVPSHQTKERTSGVDMVRIVQPMQHLDGYVYKDVKFKVTVYNIHKEKQDVWDKVAKENDIIFLNYTGNAWGFAMMGCMARKYGKKLVFDVDDSLWDIREDNPAYKVYKKGSESIKNFTSMVNEVDYMTTTNLTLKHVITHNTFKKHEDITIFPNYIDFKLYKHRSPFRDDHNIRLLHYGSTTHFVSLQEEEFEKGVDKIFKEYPNVTFKNIGGRIQKYKERWGERYEIGFGHSNVYTWIKDKFPEFMDETDIIVAPLSDNLYNRCKSSIKFIESASAKKPGVWQDIRQYKEVINGENGLLAYRADDWYKQIKKLIDDKELRRKMGENAYNTVRKDWRINTHVKDYAKFFKDVLDK